MRSFTPACKRSSLPSISRRYRSRRLVGPLSVMTSLADMPMSLPADAVGHIVRLYAFVGTARHQVHDRPQRLSSGGLGNISCKSMAGGRRFFQDRATL